MNEQTRHVRATTWELLALSLRYPDETLADAVASGEWSEAATELGMSQRDGVDVSSPSLFLRCALLLYGSEQVVERLGHGGVRVDGVAQRLIRQARVDGQLRRVDHFVRLLAEQVRAQ